MPGKQPASAGGWWTMDEAAKYCKVHENTIRRLIRLKRIKPGKVGRAYRFTKEQLDRDVMSGRMAS